MYVSEFEIGDPSLVMQTPVKVTPTSSARGSTKMNQSR